MRDLACESYRDVIDGFLLFLGRYEVDATSPLLHRSQTCVVLRAQDMRAPSGSATSVAIKLLSDEASFYREVRARVDHGLSPDCVVEILDQRVLVASEMRRLPMDVPAGYLHCLVMPLADRTLNDILVHEQVSRNTPLVRELARQLAACLMHLHACGLVHGDVKMLNVARLPGKGLVLLDLDAAVEVDAAAGAKYTTAGLAAFLLT
jgi:hypothetical protein